MDNQKLLEEMLAMQVHTIASLQNIANVLSSIYVLNLTIALKDKTVTFEDMDSTLEALQAATEAYEYKHTGVRDTEAQNGSQSLSEDSSEELEEMDEYSIPDNVTFYKNRSIRKN